MVNNQSLTANLYLLELKKYDLILGMDWLRKHRAIIDYEERKLKVCTFEGKKVIIKLDENIMSPSLLLKASLQNKRALLCYALIAKTKEKGKEEK